MFVPHTDSDRQEMLADIGVDSIEELFDAVPEKYRFPEMNVPKRLSEMEALSDLTEISKANITFNEMPSFLGAGAYNHYIPAGVDAILRRSEFYSAYTPYQAEISQGTLQAIFEYQSLMVNLTGMDVSNASHYDGATAIAEAVNMARLINRGHKRNVLLSPGLNPQYTATVITYLKGSDREIIGSDISVKDGPAGLYDLIDEETGIVVVQYPDFFGRIYDYTELAEKVHEAGGLLAISVNPIALGLLKTPGEMGADIVTGEGQPLGIPVSYGGPYLGILTTKAKYVRSLAGRLVGETTDVSGERGYVLTLSTREQHIRRERASSNICTNQGLMALAATVYLSLIGKNGLMQVAETCYRNAHYLAEQVQELEGFELWFDDPFFNEFAIRLPRPCAEINKYLLENNVIGGYELGDDFPEMMNGMLLAVTEMNSKDEMDKFVSLLRSSQDV